MHPMSPVVGDENLYGGVSTLPSSESIAVHEHRKPCAENVIFFPDSDKLIKSNRTILKYGTGHGKLGHMPRRIGMLLRRRQVLAAVDNRTCCFCYDQQHTCLQEK